MLTAAGDMEKDSQTPSTVFTSFVAIIPVVIIYLSVRLLPLISPLDCKLYEAGSWSGVLMGVLLLFSSVPDS